jgi:hypothetical protein
MSLRDIGAIFSRSFVIGFFIPAAVFLSVATYLTYLWYEPTLFDEVSTQDVVLAVTGLSAALAFLLQGLWNPIVVFLFQGYLSEARAGLRYYITWPLYRLLLIAQTLRFQALRRQLEDPKETVRTRSYVAWQLDRRYPQGPDRVLPTRFGNAVRASEDYSLYRWGVDNAALWPRLEALLSDREKELIEEENAQVAFFLNSCLSVTSISLWYILHNLIIHPDVETLTIIIVVGLFVASYLLYYLGVEAVIRWGTRVRVAVDLHLRELYRTLGISIPSDFADERERLGPMLSQFFLYGSPMDRELWDRTSSEPDKTG